MIDIKLIREEKEKIKELLAKRNIQPSTLDEIFELDKKLREGITKIEEVRAKKNIFNKQITKLDPTKKKDKIEEMINLVKTEKTLEEKNEELNISLENIMGRLPNLPADDVKVGKSEKENEIIKTWSQPKNFKFKPKDHMEIGEYLDLIDTKTAVKISGTRFNYLKNEAVLMQFALINYAFNILTNKDKLQKIVDDNNLNLMINDQNIFHLIIPPVLVKGETLERMSRLEPKEERYYIPSDNLYLIGSAEHSLGSMYMDQIISEERLPIRLVGYSSSFRREAGSYGKDTKGIFRVHQFDKIEMQTFTHPTKSLVEQNFLIAIQEYLMQQLDIPYRVIKMCTGDMTTPDARQIDIEAWLPSQGTYRETHTSDLTTDYQSRRLKTRFSDKNGKKDLVHINDATVFAIGRTLITLLENYQNEDGSVSIPKVLQPYLNNLKIVRPKQ